MPYNSIKMLQRIQTVWIFLSIIGTIFLFITGQDYSLFGPVPFISIVCVILVFLGFISILSFKDRKRQSLLNKISIFINALLLGLLAYWLLTLSGGINFPEKGIEPLFPLLSIVSLIIANVYIAKDERLVKSVDRLR
ncbi:D-alanyl-lipoteichoic acid acyltransferase DltB (MBOAT superfamily) [Chryseobacterium sp. MP_3.2]|nr:D-alanyl-lipoteichoic acid acyltransferase DltB (MBOAT superfamily) [Chryseobacterium sp. MP_3.2]